MTAAMASPDVNNSATTEIEIGIEGDAGQGLADAADIPSLEEETPTSTNDNQRNDQTTRRNQLSMYAETRSMLEHCAMMYTIAEYRQWTQKTEDDLPHLPWKGNHLLELMEETKEQFLEKYKSDGPERVSLIQGTLERWQSHETQLLVFDDQKQDTELVYAIWVDPFHRRLVLAFRGSVTKTDWRADATALHTTVNIQNRGLPDKEKRARFHKGFYDYMFSASSKTKASIDDDEAAQSRVHIHPACKYAIITEQLKDLFQDYPGFDLYVTGHSLGGALCTLFSAFCATERNDIKNCDQHAVLAATADPIHCFSFAAPKVGTLRVRCLIHNAEMSGKLRFLRMVNYKDPIPNLPKDVFLLCQSDLACNLLMNCFCQSNQFRHAGFELKAYPNHKYTIRHLPSTFNAGWLFISDVLKTFMRFFFFLITILKCAVGMGENYRRYHAWLVYFNRLDQNKDMLEELTLEGLYKDVHDDNFGTNVFRGY